jgi:hypothetical protein
MTGHCGAELAHVRGEGGERLAAHHSPGGGGGEAQQDQDVEGNSLRVAGHVASYVCQHLGRNRDKDLRFYKISQKESDRDARHQESWTLSCRFLN